MHGSAECDDASGGGSGGIEGSERQRWRRRAVGEVHAKKGRSQSLEGEMIWPWMNVRRSWEARWTDRIVPSGQTINGWVQRTGMEP
jgi:hypothetical protein